MSSEDEDFRRYARRHAVHALFWFLRFFLMAALGIILLLSGMAFTQSMLPLLGVPMTVIGFGIFFYALWWVFVGRFRLLLCPICGVRGQFTKDKWAYFFRCPKCRRSADTRVPVTPTSDP
jgi:hypothetical protein